MKYGEGYFSEGLYGGAELPFGPLVPTQVWVYTRAGVFKRMYQAGAGPMVSIEFTHSENGCEEFSLEFSKAVDINKSDLIKIKVWNFFDSYFYGVTRSIPIEGSTNREYKYTGYGMSDYFKRINSGEFAESNKTLYYITDKIMTTLVAPNCYIDYNVGNLDLPNITLTTFNGHYVQVSEMLDAILKIANSTGDEYMYGVDRYRRFFFKPRDEKTIAMVSTGRVGKYGIPAYEPTDSSDEISSLMVLKKDGTYWTTITADGDNDINQEKVTGPDIADADLTLWATGIVKDKERTLRSASIEWALFGGSPVVVSDGYLRVLSTIPPQYQEDAGATSGWGQGTWGGGYWGGGPPVKWKTLDDTLAIKKVKYVVNSKETNRYIELGALPLRLENAIVKIEKKQIDLTVSLGL